MNYLRKKLQGIMTCSDFEGYLRTISGAPPLTLPYSLGKDITSLTLTGNAVQNGTPSPETPVEVQGVGERTRNLFDYKYFFDNCIAGNLSRLVYEVKPNTSYTLSTSVPAGGGYASVFLSSGVVETVTTGNDGVSVGSPRTVTADENGKITITLRTVSITEAIELHEAEFASGQYWVMLVEGSYTTDTMPPYEPYGYKVPVEVGGINLFDVAKIADTSSITRDGDKLILNNYACASQLSPEDFLEMTGLQPRDTITTVRDISTIKGAANSITGRITFISRSGGASCVLSNGTAPYTSVIPDDFDSEHYIDANFYGTATPDENGDRIAEMSNIMIVKGTYAADTMPAYEPYHEPQTVNVYTDKPLYGQSGEAWSEIVYDGTEDWYANGTSGDGTLVKYFLASQTKIGVAGTRKCVCTHYPKTTHNVADWWEQDTCQAYGFTFQKGWFGICVNITDYPTVDAWKAFLQAQYAAGTPVKAYFAAEESAPAETTAPTYKGTTIISADTAVPPSSMTARYYATQKED